MTDSKTQNSTDTWVVIPAFNEGAQIATVIDRVLAYGYQVVVVDDGSETYVGEHIYSEAVHICRHIVNLGQGAALQTGIKYALMNNAQYIVTFDADGQHSADEISRLLQPLKAGSCDIVLGSRFMSGGAAVGIPKSKSILLHAAIIFSKFASGLSLTDTHNGFRAMTAKAAHSIAITQNGMAHATQILTEISRHKLRMQEVPVTITYTEYSLQKGQKLSNAFNIAWESMMEMFRK